MYRARPRPEQLERLARPLVGGLVLLVALIGLIGSAISDPRPHDIPVGLVGPDAAVQKLTTAFGSAVPGSFHFMSYPSEDAGRAALDSRAVDGVLLLSPGGPRLVLAGAAGGGLRLGAPGLALAVLVVVLLDLVASGGPVGSRFLPDFYRWLAGGMPAGHLYDALRGSLYFGGAAVGDAVLVLVAWLAGGLLLLLLGEAVYRRAPPPTLAATAARSPRAR